MTRDPVTRANRVRAAVLVMTRRKRKSCTSNCGSRENQPYRISVVRADRPCLAEMYRVSLCEPLPTIRIPLRREDADVPLNLQTLIDAAYVNGRYADDLDYSKPPRPKLTGPDAEWAERVLGEQGLRQGG